MHSNGGPGLVPEALSSAAGESRRVGNPAALLHRRSLGGRGLIAGASCELLRAIFGRRLNVRPEGIDEGPNKNRMSVAFSIEKNSGIDCDGSRRCLPVDFRAAGIRDRPGADVGNPRPTISLHQARIYSHSISFRPLTR